MSVPANLPKARRSQWYGHCRAGCREDSGEAVTGEMFVEPEPVSEHKTCWIDAAAFRFAAEIAFRHGIIAQQPQDAAWYRL
jgi:hypothetical protein